MGCRKMLNLNDFKVGEKAYILYKHQGYNKRPEIIETTVKKVGRQYVTVEYFYKRFKRHGNIDGLLEHADWGELGILFKDKESAELEKKTYTLIHNIQQYMNYLYNCKYEDLKTIMDILERSTGKKA